MWNHAQIRRGARIGRDGVIGRDVFIDEAVTLGDRVKIQNRALVYHGVTIADGVFIGPGAILTNDRRPRSLNADGRLARAVDWMVSPIRVAIGASIGAGAVVVAGRDVGPYAMVGAGAVVTHDVPAHALVVGNPARQIGWVCVCGERLAETADGATSTALACPTCARRYDRHALPFHPCRNSIPRRTTIGSHRRGSRWLSTIRRSPSRRRSLAALIRSQLPGLPLGAQERQMRGRYADDALVAAAIGWDVRNWSRAIPLWQRQIDIRRPRNALAIGERGGGLSLWLASQGIEVVCSDLGVSFEGARALHARFGVSGLISYEDLDATAIAHPDEAFDLVIFKSVLGALRTKQRQEQALGEIYRVLRPGGVLLFAENLVGSSLHARLRSRFVPWEGGWRYLDMKNDANLFDAFDIVELETWGVFGLFGRTEAQRDLLGRIDTWVGPHVPVGWRYILFGACLTHEGVTRSRPRGRLQTAP